MKRLIFGLALFAMSSAAASDSHADAIFVSYTVSGTPGDYDLDFRVTNNMTAWHQNVYLFGVSLSGFDAAGSPPPFVSRATTAELRVLRRLEHPVQHQLASRTPPRRPAARGNPVGVRRP